jgi:hypothetical protein
MTTEGLFVSTDGSGNISNIKQHTDWDRDWNLIIPGNFARNDNYTDLLFYNRRDGIGLFVDTDGSGNISRLRQYTDWDRDWNLIVPGNFGGDGRTDLLLYNGQPEWAYLSAPSAAAASVLLNSTLIGTGTGI